MIQQAKAVATAAQELSSVASGIVRKALGTRSLMDVVSSRLQSATKNLVGLTTVHSLTFQMPLGSDQSTVEAQMVFSVLGNFREHNKVTLDVRNFPLFAHSVSRHVINTVLSLPEVQQALQTSFPDMLRLDLAKVLTKYNGLGIDAALEEMVVDALLAREQEPSAMPSGKQ